MRQLLTYRRQRSSKTIGAGASIGSQVWTKPDAGRGPALSMRLRLSCLRARNSCSPRWQGVRDSKTLSLQPAQTGLFEAISGVALSVGVGWSDAAEIDQLGIVPATRLAMWRALAGLAVEPQVLILDALRLPASPLPQVAFPKADATCLSVAAASIVAKVSRDYWMIHHAEVQYPGYGFARHKGYGTAAHAAALDRLGVCPLHRRSFRPIAERLGAVHDSDGCRDRATGAR